MYMAKSKGNSRIEIFEPEMLSEALSAMQLKHDLKDAIDLDQLSLYFQPIVDLQTGRIAGVEALARWFHSGRGMVSPAEFIPAAEETGLIVPLGAQLLAKACAAIARFNKRDPRLAQLWLSFNISARELVSPGFVTGVRKTIQKNNVDPRRLVLEVTESLLMEDVPMVSRQLTALSSRGIRIAIDDFGTGQSSLSLIGSLPATILKIDRVFVANFDRASIDKTLTKTMLHLAHALKMEVVAEGIERPSQLEVLKALECRWGQGYLLSTPLDEAALVPFLIENLDKSSHLAEQQPTSVEDLVPT
jgi:EAL domain-containing protein (putative c-di-GMP-specific phosphodiesterase class I)